MIRKGKGNRQFIMFGIMAVLLGSGDAFHLVPRAVALCTTGLENFTVQMWLGKWITSITMTILKSYHHLQYILYMFCIIISPIQFPFLTISIQASYKGLLRDLAHSDPVSCLRLPDKGHYIPG